MEGRGSIACLTVKFCPMASRIILKKHSTSSDVLALGCSALLPLSSATRRRHSLPSMLVVTATRVSLENPIVDWPEEKGHIQLMY